MRFWAKCLLIVVLSAGFWACTQIAQLQKEAPVVETLPVSTPLQEPPAPVAAPVAPIPALSPALEKYCQQIDTLFEKYKWPTGACSGIHWSHVRDSVNGMPLFWTVFGDEESTKLPTTEVTLLMCGVHGDEITPVQFCFDAIDYFKQRKDLFAGRVLIVAPIVNPDSFFALKPTRTNARGVDINRNFPSKDWHEKAHRYWRDRYQSDKRRNPGHKPMSEPEVVFQINLIKRYKPDKIISVHAPLTLLDLDGPEITSASNDNSIEHAANELLIQMSMKAKGYKVKNYPFFPGSLGNWAGNERRIPTYTLELPDSDPANTDKFWEMFRDAMHSAVTHPFKVVQKDLKGEAADIEQTE